MIAEAPLSDPTGLSASEIARAVRDRMMSIPEVVDSYLQRIEEASPLNAVAWCEPDDARRQAKDAQDRLDHGELLGPLGGVPFTVKDVIATGGVPTVAGSRALDKNVPREDAPVVASMKRAGGILLAKTTCSEFALFPTTESPAHGRTISPWGASLSPGGSSGGEATLIAVNASILGLGTDFGGSLRWPAQCTGVLALRPTIGRVPAVGQLPGAGGSVGDSPIFANPATLQGQLQVIGPLARTVDDLALALSVLDAPDLPYTAAFDPENAAKAPPSKRSFAWCIEDPAVPCSDEVRSMMNTVADALLDAGLDGQHLPHLLQGGCEHYDRLRELDTLAEIRLATRGAKSRLGPSIREELRRPTCVDATQLSLAWRAACSWRAAFVEELRKAAVVIVPVAPGDATGHEGTLTVAGRLLEPREVMTYCRAISLTGLPVVSIPCGLSPRGLPLSVQIVGRPFGEADVLAVAGLIERLLGGARMPPRPPDSTATMQPRAGCTPHGS